MEICLCTLNNFCMYVNVLLETIGFYLCHAKKKLLKIYHVCIYIPVSCKSMQVNLEIDVGVGLMAPHLALSDLNYIHI